MNVTLNIFVNSISSIDDFNMVCLHFENYFFCKLQCLRLKLNPISLKLTKLHFYSQSGKTNLHNIYIYSYISRNILSLHMYKYFFNGILGLPKAVLQTSLPKSRQKDSLEKIKINCFNWASYQYQIQGAASSAPPPAHNSLRIIILCSVQAPIGQ